MRAAAELGPVGCGGQRLHESGGGGERRVGRESPLLLLLSLARPARSLSPWTAVTSQRTPSLSPSAAAPPTSRASSRQRTPLPTAETETPRACRRTATARRRERRRVPVAHSGRFMDLQLGLQEVFQNEMLELPKL